MTTEQLTAIILAAMAAPGFWEILKNLVDKALNRKRVTNEEIAQTLDEIQQAGLDKRLWQYFATLVESPDAPDGYAVCLRATQAAQLMPVTLYCFMLVPFF